VSSPGPDDLDRIVAVAAARCADVLAAYVFGSRARGDAHAASDLDVAVLELRGSQLSLDEEDRLRRALTAATGLAIDVAFLRPSAPVLAFEVLDGGRRVFVRDAEAADSLEESLLRRFLDTEHLRRVQRSYFFGAEE
jgi:hypothetical protein